MVLAYFGQNLVAMATSLESCNQKCLLQIGRPRRLPVISNWIPVASHSNVFKAILVPKLVLSLMYRSVTDELPDSTNPISKPISAYIWCIQLKLWPLLWYFLPILAKNCLPWQYPLDTCNQKCPLWIGRPQKPPVVSNHIVAIWRRNAFIRIYSNFSPKNWLPW